MKHLKPYSKILESKINFDYDKFNSDQDYRTNMSFDMLNVVKEEVKDEILEFFYSLIDELDEGHPDRIVRQSDMKESGQSSYSYFINKSFYPEDHSSHSNYFSKRYCNFIVGVAIDAIDFNSDTMVKEVESIYNSLVDSGYKCSYSSIHKTSRTNMPSIVI